MQKFVIFTAMAICMMVNHVVAANMKDYCQTPPFISATPAPNVLLMVDNSGSMSNLAYPASVPYNPNRLYEGYFDPEKNYALINGIFVETGSSTCEKVCAGTWSCQTHNTGTCAAKGSFGCPDNKYACCSDWGAVNCDDFGNGNYLNYQNMARIDLLRWAMTGGKPAGCNNSIQTCDPSFYGQPSASLPCDATGCTLETESGIQVKARWGRITGDDGGLLYQLKKLPVQPRIGSMYFGGTGVNRTVFIGDFTGSASYDGTNPYKNSIVALNDESPTGSTPTGPALWAAYAYLAQTGSVFGSPSPQTGGNEWKNPMYQCFDADNNGNCQGNELVQVPCAKNFIILLSDGQWNKGGIDGSVVSTCNIDTGYESSSADPVVPAYWLHKKGYINAPTNLKSSVDALYSLGLWLGGTGERSLEYVSMFGGFDTTKTWPGDMTDYPKNSCTADDCGTAGKGSPCTALPPSSSDWDKNGNNIPDTYFEAQDASNIKNQIMAIIFDILQKASSGTAVSVLSSSEGSGANLMQALFYPKRSFSNNTEVSWTSDLMNYWYYMDPFFSSMQIREDTIREAADYTLLDLKRDYITSFAYDSSQIKTLAYLWEDTAGTGSIATATAKGAVPIEDTQAIWRAGFNLWWMKPSTRNLFTSLDGTTRLPFTITNIAHLDDYLGQTASPTAANATINYVLGYDCVDATGVGCACGTAGCSTKIGRSRTVTTGVCSARKSPCDNSTDCPSGETCEQETHVWKMGDIISSTPRIMGPGYLNSFHAPPPYGYNDQSYANFIKSNDYQDRQLVFVGANDGMLHAFKLGKLLQKWSGKQWHEAAKQEGTTGAGGMGSESYAFIPKNALPYLQYFHDEDYCHIYMTDGPTTLIDASIHKPSTCTLANYWDCPKITTMKPAPLPASGYIIDYDKTSWRATLIGSMGIGGATCDAAAADPDRISTPLTVSGNPVGWSSYFALDVTNQSTPQPLWEFSHPDLGATNVGAGIVKVGGNQKRCTNNDTITCSTDTDCSAGPPGSQCITTNGKWLAILASGSTGPITSLEFKGRSDKTLKLFVLDLKTGALVRFIDTGIANAFAGSISTSAIDFEKTRSNDSGNYQDDAIYIGYVQNAASGGVLRLVINDDIDPNNWTWSKVIDNIGPVTTSVANLLDRKTGKFWLYFGEGRYFYKSDDLITRRKLFGIQEPCFDSVTNSISPTCTTTLDLLIDLQPQTTPTEFSATKKGWYIELDDAVSPNSAERVISNPTPDPLGAIYFLSFSPTDNICGFGGTTYLWALDYKTGGQVTYELQGKALVQVSTGEIKELKLSEAFTEHNHRKSVGFLGIPPVGQGIMIISNPSPIKKFMHIQEE